MLTNSHDSALGKVLLQTGLLSQTELNNAFELSKKQKQNLLLYILQNFPISSLSISEACAAYFGLPHRQLLDYPRENLSLSIIDKEIIQRYQVIPLQQQEQILFIAMADPDEFSILEDIQYQTRLHTQAIMAPYDQLTQLINRLLSSQRYLNPNEETQAVDFVEQILTDSVHRQASDIHFEALADRYRVRLRIDGLLHEITQAPATLSHSITSRLKIMAQCDISEKRLPQDGRFAFTTPSGHRRDCRLSTCPSVFGEKMVIRLLEAHKKILAMNELGLRQQDQDILIRALSEPQGLILVTGPTGSGKTITLYTALAYLNRKTHNISTAEEPVEITLPGINQVNVHEKAGLNFATVLRAFLRQDPDIIMVGEIRDRETAEIAVRAAQTGHLVLSTLHTNSAADTVTRLLNMGIAPYNISGSLLLIIAQRLVRKLCQHCKQSLIQTGPARTCAYCIDGYHGREGVFELMPVSKTLRSLILQGNKEDIFHQAQQEGMLNLWQTGLQKVQQGITSPEEIYRVIGYEYAF
jgi:type IV pilus assembly protein PilB